MTAGNERHLGLAAAFADRRETGCSGLGGTQGDIIRQTSAEPGGAAQSAERQTVLRS